MQEPTIALTDMQMERLAEEERRQGLPTDVLIRLAVDAFLGRNGATPSGGQIGHDEENVPEGHAGGEEPSPQLWYVGLGRSGDTDTSERSEDIIVEEWGDWMLSGDDPPKRRPSESTRSSAAAEAPDEERRSRER